MARTKADAKGSGTTEKGPLWRQFKDIVVGRVLRRTQDSRRGVIIFPKYNVCEHKLKAFCSVKWDDEPSPQDIALDDVKQWILDEFASDNNLVPHKILDYQENDWHPLTDAFQRARDPPPKVQKKALASPASEEAGPSNKAKGRKQEIVAAPAAPSPARVARATRGVQAVKETVAEATRSVDRAPTSRKRGAASKAVVKSSESSEKEKDEVTEDEESEEQPPDNGTVLCVSTNRRLPADLCYTAGDTRLAQIAETEYDGDYVVERIMDEIVVGKKKHFLVKWKGFELNVGGDKRRGKGDWEPESNLQDCAALEAWEKQKPDWWLAQDSSLPKAARGRKKGRH